MAVSFDRNSTAENHPIAPGNPGKGLSRPQVSLVGLAPRRFHPAAMVCKQLVLILRQPESMLMNLYKLSESSLLSLTSL